MSGYDAPASIRHYRTPLAIITAIGTTSFILLTSLVTYVAFFLYRRARRSPFERMLNDRQQPTARFHVSECGWLWASLIGSQMLVSVGFLIMFRWIHLGELPPVHRPSPPCQAQSIIFQIGNSGSALSSLLIGLYLFGVLVLGSKPSRRVIISALVFAWVAIAVIAGIGKMIDTPAIPFYASSGLWCGVSPEYKHLRLWLNFLLVFLADAMHVILYFALLAQYIRRRLRKTEPLQATPGTSVGVAKAMILYPFVYMFCVMPLALQRMYTFSGRTAPVAWLLVGYGFNAFAGTFYFIIYLITRRYILARLPPESDPLQLSQYMSGGRKPIHESDDAVYAIGLGRQRTFDKDEEGSETRSSLIEGA